MKMRITICLYIFVLLSKIVSGQIFDTYCRELQPTQFPEQPFCNDNPWELVFEDEFNGNTLNLAKWEDHLPGVPSASEVARKGINVGEFQNILLQKIEEQALYIIELKKEINEIKRLLNNK